MTILGIIVIKKKKKIRKNLGYIIIHDNNEQKIVMMAKIHVN